MADTLHYICRGQSSNSTISLIHLKVGIFTQWLLAKIKLLQYTKVAMLQILQTWTWHSSDYTTLLVNKIGYTSSFSPRLSLQFNAPLSLSDVTSLSILKQQQQQLTISSTSSSIKLIVICYSKTKKYLHCWTKPSKTFNKFITLIEPFSSYFGFSNHTHSDISSTQGAFINQSVIILFIN
jgi:hypothetical protein